MISNLLIALIAAGVLGVVLALLWHLIAIGCEEPLVNQRKTQWWSK